MYALNIEKYNKETIKFSHDFSEYKYNESKIALVNFTYHTRNQVK